jgi:hypothetical protein
MDVDAALEELLRDARSGRAGLAGRDAAAHMDFAGMEAAVVKMAGPAGRAAAAAPMAMDAAALDLNAPELARA